MGDTTDLHAPTEHAEHVAALSRLVLLGWIGAPVGNPAAPEYWIYRRAHASGVDAVLVSGHDCAEATRKNTFGTVTRRINGTPADVVAEVLAW